MIKKIFLICFFVSCSALFFISDTLPEQVRYISQDFLPWLIVPILIFLVPSLIRFSLIPSLVGTITVIFWATQIGISALPSGESQVPDLTIVTQDMNSEASVSEAQTTHRSRNNSPPDNINRDVKTLLESNPDIIALQGIKNAAIGTLVGSLSPSFPFWHIFGTVGIWSKKPLENAVMLQLGSKLTSAGKIDIKISKEQTVRMYVVSLRKNQLDRLAQDEYEGMIKDLSVYLSQENSEKLIVVGGFGMSARDSRFKKLLKNNLKDMHTASWGFDFTWPSVFPLIDLDHILSTGFTATGGKLIHLEGSDHKGILMGLKHT
ncbi:endonuclease/exonuclease/phosphatase family protein [Tropheryma whipplei]|uniref:Endonuclease/exonuclease/phosphatase domain-containing protein n=1 Tax=Tropheryma whipplei (strain Twist) TaxID=203267 RepID=Q83GA3_TROWT|nr:endonuclease/exonuclease/phosphatase family protein [Tropheryma whipplei]AAO44507.1 unknown [Tropheryma whipplei str. Twist]MCO8182328.1 endonuclease/exonuclease/phosphatase family protein [Tropheryma whipplei]MCO8190097.1 endonuclease/exonuclease/phosphatase family protein [Tropheryma whipplei]CAD67030.1 putative membrane protein [Tropheryma whipplei TW08/27]